MRRSRKALVTCAAIASGPRGLRRLLGAAVILVLVVVLGAVVLAHISKGARGHDEPYPCAPAVTTVKISPDNAPSHVREMVEQTLTAAGRKPKFVDYGDGERPDLVVSWWPTRDPNPPRFQGRTLHLEYEPTVDEVTAVLKHRLTSCEADSATAAPAAPAPSARSEVSPRALDWSSPVALIGGVTGLWWLAGPWITRTSARALKKIRAHRVQGE